MSTHRYSLPLLAAIAIGLGGYAATPTLHAENLLLHRVQQEKSMNLPARGMTMAQVEKRYGAPTRKLSPRGGGSHAQPVINRWEYSNFIVYFEHSHVIHSVLNTPAGNNAHPASAN